MSQTIHEVVRQAWHQFQAQTIDVLPHVMASSLVLVLGILLGMLVRRLAHWVLQASRLDHRAATLGLSVPLEAIGIRSTVRATAKALQVAIIFFSSILALYSLDPRLASDLAERFLLYLPHLLVAIATLGGGLILARYLARSVLIAAVNSELPFARLLAGLTRGAVLVVAVAITLEQLGVGRVTVLIAFAILFGGATLASAIALGLGLQDLVRAWVGRQLEPGRQPPEAETLRHW